MIFGIVLLFVIGLVYLLLIKGFLWKIILGVLGACMLQKLLMSYFPATKSICITLGKENFTWATALAVGVLLLAMMHTKVEQ